MATGLGVGSPITPEAGSFRDPWGFVYQRDGVLYRQVNSLAQPAYEALYRGGLYAELVRRGWLVAHDEVPLALAATASASVVVRPEWISVLSWPYEWSFSALKDAALLTLDIAALALAHGLVLRDASAYNVQFRGSRPVFIDTLSFAPYKEGRPWVAYGQFCRHFLSPLALMSKVDVRLQALLRTHMDGVPLDLADALLPWRSWLSPGLVMHLRMHARAGGQRHTAEGQAQEAKRAKSSELSKHQLMGMLDSLRATIDGLSWRPVGTEWGDYYQHTNYSADAMDAKTRLVRGMLTASAPESVWDIGGNTGRFAKIASDLGANAVAFDVDPAAVEVGYCGSRDRCEPQLWNLLQDLTNPSPDQGWAHAERAGLERRAGVDVVMALALVHHLAIANNVPLQQVGAMLATLGRSAIVEFVPKSDSQVRRMLASREDVFDDYTPEGFERAMAASFSIAERAAVGGSDRLLYRLVKRTGDA